MVEFAGYLMPVQYQSVIAEAQAVRDKAGMFDVSHMARLRITGNDALTFLEAVTTNDVTKLTDGTGHYSLLPNHSGGLVDDIIVYRDGPTAFRMVVNASNHGKDVAHLVSENKWGVDIYDETSETAMIAVQGPAAADIVAKMAGDADALRNVPFFSTVQTTVAGIDCFCARSGYTGEDGYELVCASERAVELWDALVHAGVAPCGLGSRDTLRVEAGLPLYGHELADDLSPISAGLGWVISKTKEFVGSAEINKARAEGTPFKLQGIRMDAKRIPSQGMNVVVNGNQVGTVTSGVYSPLLGCGIAFAFIDSTVKLETPCEVEVRGKLEPGTIVSKRFFKRQ